jgi:signal transduction histidine kinase
MKNIKPSYVFNLLAFFILLATIFMYNQFNKTKDTIKKTNIESNLEYVDEISDNILEFIKEDLNKQKLVEVLDKDEKEIDKFESYLRLFSTTRYRYIYLIDKENIDSPRFRILLDGSENLEDKSEFMEPFMPLNNEEFTRAYKTKSSVYFRHQDDTKLWMTYIKPFVVNGNTEALLVFDFSLKDYDVILKLSNKLSRNFKYGFSFFLIVLLIIIWFSYVDLKREKQKEFITEQLKLKSFELEKLNENLEEKVKKEIEKNRLKDQQLLEQSRLAQMGEMISMIAHQWRQPLNAISSMSTSIKVKLALGKADAEFLNIASDKISHSAQYLSQTIDDFRNFYKSQKELQESSFEEIVQDVMKIIGVSLENKNIDIVLDIQSHDRFNTYTNELKQVLMNLIKNAEDVFLESEISEAKILIKIYKDDEYHVISVADNAGGIDESIMKKIFDPYFSTKKQKDGTGLGLYMSKIIVEEHCQGKLEVSNVDGGACFTIKVPNMKFS